MSDTTTDNNITVIVPKETQEKFPQLVVAIQNSKSMDAKEMNYWLQVLPIMTEEQIDELKDILNNEKNKLQEIENKYASPAESTKKSPEEIAKEEALRKKKREEQKEKERLARQSENVDDILSQLDFA